MFTVAHFYLAGRSLLGASISHFLTAALNFHVLRNSSPLFSMTRSGSQSLLKNKAEKDMTLLLFFLSKSPGAHVISSQIKPWVAFGFPYLSIACGAYGRSLARSVYGHVITKFSEMGRLPHFLCYELRYKVSWPVKGLRYQTQIGIYRKQSFVLFYFLFCISSLDFICLLGLEDDTNIQQITEYSQAFAKKKGCQSTIIADIIFI